MSRFRFWQRGTGLSVDERARKCIGFCFWLRDGETVAMSFDEIRDAILEFDQPARIPEGDRATEPGPEIGGRMPW